jgi:hypothetical protein
MGTKSMAALEAMKQTQISLGFTNKDVELEESKPLLQLMQGIKRCLCSDYGTKEAGYY